MYRDLLPHASIVALFSMSWIGGLRRRPEAQVYHWGMPRKGGVRRPEGEAEGSEGDSEVEVRKVFEYLDYRDMLKDAYEARKARQVGFSYRMMASILGSDASYLHRVLQKEFHLPSRCIPKALQFLDLAGRQAEYFQMIVAHARARTRRERQEILEKALALRDVERRSLESRELEFLRFWWGAGTRCVLEVVEGRPNPEEIAGLIQPPVPVEEIRKTLDLLLELGLVRKGPAGRLIPAEAHLTAAGEGKIEAVRSYQAQVLELAKESLARFPPGERDVSTLSMAVDTPAFEEIREILRDCRRRIQKRSETVTRPDQVHQLAMAIFPIAPPPRRT
jgi:uncharacterized protein (TIGR02147 family)